MNEEEITEILDKLLNRKQETLLQGLRECQLKNIEHVFITREEYIDKVLNYLNDLQQENQELKKQLEASRRVAKHHLNRELELENQQKEFIKYLEDEIKRLEENNIYQSLQQMALETHKHNLSKYKEIIGNKYEEN